MRSLKKIIFSLLLISLTTVIFAKAQQEVADDDMKMESMTEAAPMSEVKFVFLFIGDGMGLPQINAAEAYLATKAGKTFSSEKLNFSVFPAQGLTTTYASDQYITDSAAAATAVACGEKTNVGVIAMNASVSMDYKTLVEIAAEKGMKTGVISSVDLDHATPAAFYAHNPSRNNYYDIGVDAVNSAVNYFGGGRFRLSKTPEGKANQHELFEQAGWTLADNRGAMNAITAGTDKVYCYNYGFASDALPYAIDRDADGITLAEFTAKGIELLDNENGFFIMVEGGKIDWACHANDAATTIHDTLAFADSVQEAIDFYNAHPDETLIVVTGDHECGGLTIGFAGTQYASAFDVIATQKGSHEYFDKFVTAPYLEAGNASLEGFLPQIEEYFGLSDFSEYEMGLLEKAFKMAVAKEEITANHTETALLYGGYNPISMQLTHIIDNRAGLAWTSYSHTGIPVPTFAMGPDVALFNGYYDNTDIFHKIMTVMN